MFALAEVHFDYDAVKSGDNRHKFILLCYWGFFPISLFCLKIAKIGTFQFTIEHENHREVFFLNNPLD
jgi:hypothetical protein